MAKYVYTIVEHATSESGYDEIQLWGTYATRRSANKKLREMVNFLCSRDGGSFDVVDDSKFMDYYEQMEISLRLRVTGLIRQFAVMANEYH